MKKKNEALWKWLDGGSDSLDREIMESVCGAFEEEITPEAAPAPIKTGVHPVRKRTKSVYMKANAVVSVVLCLVVIVLLMYMVMDMPYFGNADTLLDSEVSEFYLEHTLEHTGAVNVISGIILNFRGFDTLGEAHVLFIAVCSVMILLNMHPSDRSAHLLAYDYDESSDEPHDDEILKGGASVLFPMIVMFGIYIILNGNLSPGGGFSGGSVIGAGLILYLSVFGYVRIRRFFTARTFKALSTCALLLYSISKTYHFVTGANGLPSGIGTGTPGSIFSGGLLLPLNIFVGVVVACTMYALFTMFRKGDF